MTVTRHMLKLSVKYLNSFSRYSRSMTSAAVQGSKARHSPFLDPIQFATGLAFGIIGYKAYDLATEWPEGNQLLFNSMRDDKLVRNFMGYPILALPTWEGTATSEMVRVEAPVLGTKCYGTLSGAAVKKNGQWLVLACEVQPVFAISGGDNPLPKPSGHRQAALSGIEQHPPTTLAIAVAGQRAYDVLAKRWMDSLYSIGAESDFTKYNAKTSAKVEVVEPDASSDDSNRTDHDR